MDAGIAGQRFVVTGASGGIGGAISRALHREGAGVVIHYHRNRAAASRLADELGPPSLCAGADLTRESEVHELFAAACAAGPIDGIVVNAGIWEPADVPLHEMTLAQWQRTMAADLTSAFLTCRAFLRHLAARRAQHAAIVLIGSTAGRFGEAGHADYAAAKAAMTHGMTASLKNEIVRLVERGRVNCVSPGWVRTPMAATALADPTRVARATATVAMRKVADPDDIARACVFLCSDRLAGHVTGAVLPVDGGMEGRLLHPFA